MAQVTEVMGKDYRNGVVEVLVVRVGKWCSPFLTTLESLHSTERLSPNTDSHLMKRTPREPSNFMDRKQYSKEMCLTCTDKK